MIKIMRIECELIRINCVHTEFRLSQSELNSNSVKPPSECKLQVDWKTKRDHFIILHVKLLRQGCKEHHSRSRFTKTFLDLANSKRISTTGRKTRAIIANWG